jgi:hypothetical protein
LGAAGARGRGLHGWIPLNVNFDLAKPGATQDLMTRGAIWSGEQPVH